MSRQSSRSQPLSHRGGRSPASTKPSVSRPQKVDGRVLRSHQGTTSKEAEKQSVVKGKKPEEERSREANRRDEEKKTEEERSREANRRDEEKQVTTEEESSREANKQVTPMEMENVKIAGLQGVVVQDLWDYSKANPAYPDFLEYASISIRTFAKKSSVQAAVLAVKVWDHFQLLMVEKGIGFSKLSLRDFGSSHGSSGTGSSPPLIFQDKGVEALNSLLKDVNFATPADDTITENLWPIAEWNAVLVDDTKKSQAKLEALIANQTEEALEVAKSVFIKPRKELCDPKTPDFILVGTEFKEVPTPENVGAILFAQSTSESSKSYSTSFAVGEAIAVGQILLRNASQQRRFIIVGVTNVRKIRWFRVERPSMAGNFNGTRSCEITSVRESLAGFMCCSAETLGIYENSIFLGQKQYVLGRWLGEGATSNVYVVNVDNAECAAKVAKPGHSISMDVTNLSKLKGIKGIPTIVVSDSHSNVIITPVAEQFTLELLFKKKMHMRLMDLVDTLQCAHGRGIVNRDVRVANILIAEDQIIIVDWGFALSLNEPHSFAGTTHFASTKVLKKLEDGQHTFVYDTSDDLVSLVRSLYVLSRLDHLRMQNMLLEIGNDEFAEIRECWETEMSDKPLWQDAERYAEQSDYTGLKLWIQNWAKLSW